MGLDIRLPIGFLFSIFGVLLIAFGALSDKALYECSLGININLEWAGPGASDYRKIAKA